MNEEVKRDAQGHEVKDEDGRTDVTINAAPVHAKTTPQEG